MITFVTIDPSIMKTESDLHTLPTEAAIASDLLKPSKMRQFWELARPFAFLLAFFIVAMTFGPFWGVPLLVAVFIANICAAHDVVHNALRMKKRSRHILLSIYGIIVMQSGHAFRVTHLSHHATFPSPQDPEGEAAGKSLFQAILMGPLYVPRLWYWAMNRMRKQSNELTWMLAEASMGGLIYLGSILLIPFTLIPIVYVVVMTLGAWLYPLVTSHLPHSAHGDDELHQSKSIHGKVMPYLLLGLNYHLEHHLYPRVPAYQLGKLSKRLLPYFEENEAKIIYVP